MHPPLVKAPAQNCFYSAFNFEALQGTFDISNILSHKQGRYFPLRSLRLHFPVVPTSSSTSFPFSFPHSPFPIPAFRRRDHKRARPNRPRSDLACLPECMPCLPCSLLARLPLALLALFSFVCKNACGVSILDTHA